MIKKLGTLFLITSLILLATACQDTEKSSASSEENTNATSADSSEKNDKANRESKEDISEEPIKIGDTYEIEGGTAKLKAITNKETTLTAGPMKLKIKGVIAGVANEQIPFIQVDLDVKNTSKDVIEFYPDGILATSTGVQINQPSSEESDDILGTYVGKVNSKGSIFYVLDNKEDLENLKWIRLLIIAPRNSKTNELLSDDIDLKINLEH
ncbi:hypothetical protein P4282_23970 [Bacillus swezeyi]|uniref:hypothetical protein n=1 Tax=Bacillus swezeyi TaxID=1925020 RepID=UPI002E1C7490|nr:hypothetical protein [Bacillus swezeyi]